MTREEAGREKSKERRSEDQRMREREKEVARK